MKLAQWPFIITFVCHMQRKTGWAGYTRDLAYCWYVVGHINEVRLLRARSLLLGWVAVCQVQVQLPISAWPPLGG